MYYSVLPENFQPEKDKIVSKKHVEYARAWLHVLIERIGKLQKDEEQWIPLKVKRMELAVGQRLERPVRLALIEAGVIECDNKYYKGKKCTWYRLAPAYRRMPLVAQIFVNQKLGKQANQSCRVQVENPVHEHLWKWLNEVRFDAYSAFATLAKGQRNVGRQWYALHMLSTGRLFFCTDHKTGRVFTNITNLLTKFRQYLSFNGSDLVNIDVRNSQPLIFSVQLLDFYKKEHNIKPHPIHMGVQFNPLKHIPHDVRLFIRLCQKGLLYDYMIKKWDVRQKKQQFKRSFFANIFFSEAERSTRHNELFAATFPNVWEFIQNAKEHNNRDFPLSMQKQEADIIISGVCGILATEPYRHIPILTIHDSIMTTPEFAPVVRSIMLDQFRAKGITPTLS